MALITKEIVKSDWLNIAAGTTTHDALIDRFIDAVETEIKGICNQPIDQETVTLYANGNGKVTMLLPFVTVPVSLTTLETRQDPSESWTAVSSAYVFEEGAGWKAYLANGFTGKHYKFTLAVGYETANVPNDVKTCAYEMVKELYYETPFAADADRFGLSAISEADSTITLSKAIIAMRPRVKERLYRYTMWTV